MFAATGSPRPYFSARSSWFKINQSSIFLDFVFPPCWSPSSQALAHSPIGRPGSRSWDEDMFIDEHEDNNDHSRHCCPVSPISFLSGRQSYSCCKRQRAFQILITFTFQFKQTVLGISKPHLVVLIIVTSQAVCRPGREWHEEVSHLRQLHLQQHWAWSWTEARTHQTRLQHKPRIQAAYIMYNIY